MAAVSEKKRIRIEKNHNAEIDRREKKRGGGEMKWDKTNKGDWTQRTKGWRETGERK